MWIQLYEDVQPVFVWESGGPEALRVLGWTVVRHVGPLARGKASYQASQNGRQEPNSPTQKKPVQLQKNMF